MKLRLQEVGAVAFLLRNTNVTAEEISAIVESYQLYQQLSQGALVDIYEDALATMRRDAEMYKRS